MYPSPERFKPSECGYYCGPDQFDLGQRVKQLVDSEKSHWRIVAAKDLPVGLPQLAPKLPIGGDVGNEDMQVDEIVPRGAGALEGQCDVATSLRELIEQVLGNSSIGPVSRLTGQKNGPPGLDHRGMGVSDGLGKFCRVDEEMAHQPPNARPIRAVARS